jgi:hypothetical protein
MNTILMNDENDGGIVFVNTDPNPVTVTGLTFDVFYSYLTTTERPLVLRFLSPTTNQSLADYHLENLPADPTLPYTHSQSNATVSVSFTVPGSSQKMLPVAILGVTKMLEFGTSPAVTVAVRGITTNRSGMKTTLSSPTITWTCTIAATGYDPNGPGASQACHG